MGTPDFAVPSLDILVKNGYEVVGVVTATDKLGGRSRKQLLQSPVKKYAVEHQIPVLQPKNLKSEAFLQELRSLQADLQVVVAFRMLPEVVWDMPSRGTFNLHGSLLPKYRGAAPINWAIINGETTTGVTTFMIQHQIDTGDILFQESLPIGENETAGEVHDRMMQLGAKVVLKTVRAIEKEAFELKEQDSQLASKAPKLYHETSEIDFHQPCIVVHNFIRGLSPYPAAWTRLEEQKLKILRTRILPKSHSHDPGSFHSDDKNYIRIACLDGYIEVQELQLQGRKKMNVKDFLNGYSFES
jgi:methionyl-tRNA formyltransferase